MKKIFTLSLFIFIGISFPQITLEQAENYPRWMKSGSFRTDQTSGITFLGRGKKNILNFLIADDIGDIYRFQIRNDSIFNFEKVIFSSRAKKILNKFVKKDFEEIFYDHHTDKVYLSIEGNEFYDKLPGKKENYLSLKESVGIYQVKFSGSPKTSNKIIDVKKLPIRPDLEFYEYVSNNFGFEGAAVDENYFYFGFEGFASGKIAIDSAVIFVVEKKSLTIQKKIFTGALKIQSICGLFCAENFSLWGVDRNKREVFFIKLDEKLNIIEYEKFQLNSPIPHYNNLEYVMMLESITMDDKKNIYMIDDPWKSFFVPSSETLNMLDKKTRNNFKDFIPVIHKYKISKFNGGAQ